MLFCFHVHYGLKVVAIIDCFELFIEKPLNLLVVMYLVTIQILQHSQVSNKYHTTRCNQFCVQGMGWLSICQVHHWEQFLRVIGCVQQKFTIFLSATAVPPQEFHKNDDIVMLDAIVCVCCVLNVSEGIIPFE